VARWRNDAGDMRVMGAAQPPRRSPSASTGSSALARAAVAASSSAASAESSAKTAVEASSSPHSSVPCAWCGATGVTCSARARLGSGWLAPRVTSPVAALCEPTASSAWSVILQVSAEHGWVSECGVAVLGNAVQRLSVLALEGGGGAVEWLEVSYRGGRERNGAPVRVASGQTVAMANTRVG
jgi:hypothetical protein